MKSSLILFLIMSTFVINANSYEEHGNTTAFYKDEILSRRKRFIVFPDGSSFQLVFCTQNQGFLRVGDIVWFGNTAALAWELPSDPTLFHLLKDKEKVYGPNRRGDNKHIYYLNEDGKVIGKQAYHRKPIVNPAFAKRSIDNSAKLFKKKMHDMQKNTNYLTSLQENSIEFHRSGRKSLYVKVEKVLQALGWNGRECVLRMLCESKKPKRKQGTFLEEILKTTFTLPKGRDFEDDDHKLYDVAHGSTDCATRYPSCEDLHGSAFYDH